MIVTIPVGSSIFVDGNPIRGNSVQVPEGTHTIKVTREGFTDWTRTVDVTRNTMLTATLQRAQASPQVRTFSLTVNANVKDAQVFVGDTLAGTAPLTTSVAQGTHIVRVTAPGYTDYSISVNLTGNQTLSAQLQPAMASVTLNIPPHLRRQDARNPGGDFRLFVDGRPVQGHQFQVLPGAHTIRLMNGNLTLEQNFYFEVGKTYDIDFILGMIIR